MILEAAGAEAAQRRPAEVIDLPLRSAFLNRTRGQPVPAEPEPPPKPEIPEGVRVWPEWVVWAVRASKYLGFACVALAVVLAWSWARTTLILADVGGKSCAAGPINVPEYSCELNAVECFTVPQEALVSGVQAQAHTRNMALMGCAEL